MGKVRIKDSGININNPTINETVLANNGNEITLDVDTITFSVSAIVDNEPVTKYKDNDQTKEYVSLNPMHNGITSPKVSVKMYLNKTDNYTLRQLFMLLKTKGKKYLYCDLANIMYDSTQSDPYFVGFVSNLQIDDNAPTSTSHYSITFDFEVIE